MDASVESVDGDIVLKFKKFLVEEGENVIIVDVPQNFIYAYSDTVGEGHGSNRVKVVIELSTGGKALEPEKDVPVPAPAATGNDVLLDSD